MKKILHLLAIACCFLLLPPQAEGALQPIHPIANAELLPQRADGTHPAKQHRTWFKKKRPRPAVDERITDPLAIVAFVAGVLSLLAGLLGLLLAPVAIVFGLLALRRIRRNPQTLRGRPFAIIGLIMGLLAIALWGTILALAIYLGGF